MKKRKTAVSAPIFVVGPPRSGTTLTARILGRHSRIFMPGETHFFDDVYARRREVGELSKANFLEEVLARLQTLYRRYDERSDQERIDRLFQTDGVLEELRCSRSYEAIFSCFMEVQMRAVGKERWGNNVPKDIFCVGDILSFYPEAKFIVCVRDVRDFLLSYKNKWKRSAAENANRLRNLYHPALTSLVWKASVRQISQIKGQVREQNLIVIRYEDLVQNPESSVRRICDVIGEDFEEGMLKVEENNSSFEDEQKGIYGSSVGRWRHSLTAEEAYVAQKVAGGSLQEFKYAAVDFQVNPWKVGYFYATLPYGLCRAIYANRAIRGPLVPYLGARIAALQAKLSQR